MRDSSYLFTLFGIVSLAGCSAAPGPVQDMSPVGNGGTTGNAGTSGSEVPGGATSSGGASTSVGNGTGGTTQPGSGGTTSTGTTGSAAGTGASPSTSNAGATATGGGGAEALGGANAGGTTSTAGTTEAGGANGSTGGASSVGGTTGAGGATTVPIDKFIGNIAPKNQDIPADFASKWMQMSMEANSKWGFVQPDSADGWVWEPVDEAHQYAADNGIIFKQHNFFWNFEQPSWVTAGNVATVGPAWLQAFCDRYPDVPQIDVVNEPIHNKAPYREGMGGDGESGYDWVVTAYQWAREACPNSVLIVNEFNIIEWEDDHNLFIEALHKMLDAGAPIDAIGAQGHDVFDAGAEQAKIYLDALTAEFNLPIYITELDINLSDDQEQLTSMQTIIPMLWDHPNVYGITYWGFLEGKTWRPNAWLVSTSGTERPAMTWLQEFIAAHR